MTTKTNVYKWWLILYNLVCGIQKVFTHQIFVVKEGGDNEQANISRMFQKKIR